MDRMIYTAMTGANALLSRQDAVTHNLSNATSTGYRAVEQMFRAVPVLSQAQPSRAFVVNAGMNSDFHSGALHETGRSLDVAIQGEGWFVLQGADGAEALTRNGNFELRADGTLQSRTGLAVVGAGGPIVVPPGGELSIGRDGTVSVSGAGGDRAASVVVGQLKLVRPETDRLMRGEDGLFRLPPGEVTQPEPSVAVLAGALEQSNVNVVEQMVQMIGLARHFELQTKLIQTAETNDKAAQQILSRM